MSSFFNDNSENIINNNYINDYLDNNRSNNQESDKYEEKEDYMSNKKEEEDDYMSDEDDLFDMEFEDGEFILDHYGDFIKDVIGSDINNYNYNKCRSIINGKIDSNENIISYDISKLESTLEYKYNIPAF